MPIDGTITSCKAIDFKSGESFQLTIANANLVEATISLFDITRTLVQTANGWQVLSDEGLNVVVTGTNPNYYYLVQNCTSIRPVMIDAFRIISATPANLWKSIRIMERDINGTILTEPYAIITDTNIFSRQARFVDVLLNTKPMILTGNHMMKIPISASSNITVLMRYKNPPKEISELFECTNKL